MPVFFDEGDVGDRNLEDLARQPGDAIKPLLGRRIEDVKRVEVLDARLLDRRIHLQRGREMLEGLHSIKESVSVR